MIKMKHLILWLVAFGLTFFIMGFAFSKQAQVLYSQIEIDIAGQEKQPFVSQNEVKEIIAQHYLISDSLALQEINIAMLEESLGNHPSIEKAEVYSLWTGSLQVSVKQHRPLARVVHQNTGFYILTQGQIMPLSPQYSADVPLVTGSVADSVLAPLAGFWATVKNDSFFKDFFAGLSINNKGHWTLHPLYGNHKVELGLPHRLTEKLAKLQVFYTQAVTPQNLDSIKTLNLAYNQQVICRKK